MSPEGGNPPSDPPHDPSASEVVEAELQPVIKDLPPGKQQEIVRTVERSFEQQFMAVVRGGGGPQLDAETAKILAASIDRDNDNKFKYLTQQQANSATRDEHTHQVSMARHHDLVRPIVWAVIMIAVGSVAAGLAFIAYGHETVGGSLLTGVFSALLGYLGGLGTAKHYGKEL